MPDFSALLKRPAGEAKRPPPLPVGDYQAVIKSHEVGDSNRNNTPYVRFGVVLTEWPEAISPGERPEGVELNKRQLRKDFYLTEDALWRLDEFIRSCGVDPNGRMYEEVLPELIGQPITVQVQQYINPANGDIGNNTGDAVGQYGKQS